MSTWERNPGLQSLLEYLQYDENRFLKALEQIVSDLNPINPSSSSILDTLQTLLSSKELQIENPLSLSAPDHISIRVLKMIYEAVRSPHFVNEKTIDKVVQVLQQIRGHSAAVSIPQLAQVSKLGDTYLNSGQLLGRGSFAEVYLGYEISGPLKGSPVAIKKMDIHALSAKHGQANAVKMMKNEHSVMKSLKNRNVVELLSTVEQGNFFYLILEYVPGGSLADFLKHNGPKDLTEKIVRHFITQLALGLKALNDLKIVHRDLKPANILMSTRSGDSILKLADFNVAKAMAAEELLQTQVGTPIYAAPEVKGADYSEKCDLWSVGCIFLELVYGREKLLEAFKSRFQDLSLPPSPLLSDEGRSLLVDLLKPDPSLRISHEEFFSHKYVLPVDMISSIRLSVLGDDSERDKERKQLRDRCKELEKQVAQLEEKLGQLGREREKERKENNGESERAAAEWKLKIEESEKELEKAIKQAAEKEKDLREKLDRREKDFKEMRDKVGDLEKELEVKRIEEEVTQTEMKDVRDDLLRLEELGKEKSKKVIDLEKKLDDGERREREAEERFKKLSNEMAQLQENLKAEKELREQDREESRKKEEEAKKESQRNENERDEELKKRAEKIASLESLRLQYEQEKQKREEEMNKLSAELHMTEEKVKECSLKLVEQQKKSEEEKERQEKEGKERENKLQTQLEVLQESNRLLLENGEQESQERRLEKEKDQKEKEDLRQDIERLVKRNDEWKIENDKLKKEYESMKNQMEKFKAEGEQVKRDYDALRKQGEKLEKESEEWKRMFEKSTAENDEMKKENSTIRQHRESLLNELEDLKLSSESMKEEIDTLKKDIDLLSSTNETLIREKEEKELQQMQSMEEVIKLTEKLKDNQEEFKTLNVFLESMVAESDRLKSVDTDLESVKKSLLDLQSQLSQSEAEHKKSQLNFAKVKDDLLSTIQQNEKAAQEAKSRLLAVETENQKLSKEIAKLTAESISQEAVNNELRVSLKNQERDYHQLLETFQEMNRQ